MADNQVAISRMTRAASGSLSKATRQAVPPFLQKLYEMVSDSATDNLIRWSENGDSFFVLDHERVAHDVLPRWFKHSNFASFVRQLNMYGFHKIPHLQQGVLKSETETEIWNFEHPNFRRGQPDLLCLITRKKQAQERQSEDMSALGEKDGAGSGAPGLVGVGGFTPGSLVDINSIINGIAAIKRHQATISADLNDLKASNQHLWQEALDARERHQKQQDTINRILKFLAGVFGNAGAHKGSPAHGSPHAGIPRKRQRLMIEGAAQSLKDKPQPLEPLDGVEPMDETPNEETTPTNRFIEVSQSPAQSKAPSVVPDTPDPSTQFQPQPPMTADIIMGGNFTPQPFLPYSTTIPPNAADNPVYSRPNDASAPGALTSSSPGPREELLQSIINSPGSLQRLMNLLNFQQQQQNIPMPPPLDLNDTKSDSEAGYVDGPFDPYAPHPYPYQTHSQGPVPVPMGQDPTTLQSQFGLVAPPDSQTLSLLPTADDMPGISFEQPYIANAQRLKKTSDASSVIAEHVDMMDSNIESLIRHLGLDPQQLEQMRDEEFGVGIEGGDGGLGGIGEGGIGEDGEGLFNHDQSVDPTGTVSSDSSTGTGTGTGVNTKASSESSTTTATTNPNASTTNLTFQPTTTTTASTIPDFDFSAFLSELAKQHGGGGSSAGGDASVPGLAPAPGGFGEYDNKPDTHTLDFIDSSPSFSSSSSPSFSSSTANHNHNRNQNRDRNRNRNRNQSQKRDPTTSPQLSAFVDEVASQSGQSDVSGSVTASPPRTRVGRDDSGAMGTGAMGAVGTVSPIAMTVSLPALSPTSPARKRKPEVEVEVEEDAPTAATATMTAASGTRTQTKAKRKR